MHVAHLEAPPLRRVIYLKLNRVGSNIATDVLGKGARLAGECPPAQDDDGISATTWLSPDGRPLARALAGEEPF
jgi:hypothetical protein